jgi:hypothetical protein
MKVPQLSPLTLFILILVGGIASFLTFFDYGKRFISWCLKWLKNPWGSGRQPRGVQFAITQDHAGTYWQEGGRGGVLHMIVVCTLHITNSGPARLGQIVDVYIRRPFTHTNTHINMDVFYPLGLARTVTFTFEIEGRAAKSGEQFVADVVVVDQFGGEHTVKNVTFNTYGGHVWPEKN